MKSPEDVVSEWMHRRTLQGKWWAHADEVRRMYNGEITVPLPELDTLEKPATANLLHQGVEQYAQRIGSVVPNISFPAMSDFLYAKKQAYDSRRAVQGWWEMNLWREKTRRRARFLVAYGCAPVTISPVSLDPSEKRKIPFMRVRNPLSAYPSPLADVDSIEPDNCIFHDLKPLRWLKDNYPEQARTLYKGEKFDDSTMFNVLEYMDCDETVIVVVGSDRNSGQMPTAGTGISSCQLLERIPNRTGICPAVFPGRITLDTLAGQFAGMIGAYHRAAKLDSLNTIAVFRSVFPDQWVEGYPQDNRSPKVVQYADGKMGQIGIVEHGRIQNVTLQPGQMGPQLLDQLERSQRLNAGIPADFGGESASNVRTGRRGSDILGNTVDPSIQEYQEILARSSEAEIRRSIKMMKAYYGKKPSMFILPGDGSVPRPDYTPDETFVTDICAVTYPIPGTDANSLPVAIGQRVGMGTMSTETAMELDPEIDDPVREKQRIALDGLRKAALAGIEQQLNSGQMDVTLVAKIAKMLNDNAELEIEDAIVKAHKEIQKEQAAQAPEQASQQAPEQMPGLNQTPPQTPADQPTIPPPPAGATDLKSLLGALGGQSAA